MIVIILAVVVLVCVIVIKAYVEASCYSSNSGDAVIEATPSVTGDDTAAGNVLTNDTDPEDDAEWYSQPAIVRDNYECEPKVRATGKKWDADAKFRKERNSKAKNSKKKGNFKPWQH